MKNINKNSLIFLLRDDDLFNYRNGGFVFLLNVLI